MVFLVAAGFDLRVPLGAGVVLACAVFVACYFPAKRAARIDQLRCSTTFDATGSCGAPSREGKALAL